jgi:hypothetical protein
MHRLIIQLRDPFTGQLSREIVLGAPIVHVHLEIVVDGVLGVVVEAVLRFVIAVSEVVPLAGWLEIEAQGVVRGGGAAVG